MVCVWQATSRSQGRVRSRQGEAAAGIRRTERHIALVISHHCRGLVYRSVPNKASSQSMWSIPWDTDLRWRWWSSLDDTMTFRTGWSPHAYEGSLIVSLLLGGAYWNMRGTACRIG